ncbi:MAG: heme NO-binding domain-containing protein [Steroidobacteraceae bacterium]
MKGIVFNLLEGVIIAQHGEAAWDGVLAAIGSPGAYTSLGNYPDDQIERLVVASASALKMTPAEAWRWFGRKAMPLLARRYPHFFAEHRKTIPFVLSVNSIIHPEVRKLYAGAHCPHFRFQHTADDALRMTYDSPRRLCALAHGFIEGAADHFGETAAVEHLNCMHRGDAECLLEIRAVKSVSADAA